MGFNLFQNTQEMYDTFEKAQRIAVAHVTTMMIEEVQSEIDAMGIGIGLLNKVYQPTGEFREAWVGDEVSQAIRDRVSQFVEAQMGYDPTMIKTVDPINFTHGSYDIKDTRDILPYLIFGGNSGDLFGQGFWTKERDAWTKATNRFQKSWGKWLRDGFALSGIYLS